LQSSEDLLIRKLGQAFKEALDNGKMHIEFEEFDKKYREFEIETILKILNKQVQKGVIWIDNKLMTYSFGYQAV
jgi:hypothetical protein